MSLSPYFCLFYLHARRRILLQVSELVLAASIFLSLYYSLAPSAPRLWLYHLVKRYIPETVRPSSNCSAAQTSFELYSAFSKLLLPSRRKKIVFSPFTFCTYGKCEFSSFKPTALSACCSLLFTTFRCTFNSYEGNRQFDQQSTFFHFCSSQFSQCWFLNVW